MADNTRLNPGAGGDSIRTIDENGVKTQVVALSGQANDGTLTLVPVTGEGHLEVALHSPRLPFGAVHTEGLTPIFQSDGVYGLNTQEVLPTTGRSIAGANSGLTTSVSGMFRVSTGTTSYSFATIQSRKRLRYRPGQGTVGRFAGLFSTPAANAILVAGFGTAESGYYFGYNGTTFGILHSTSGVREIRTLTVTTASTASNNYTVTLDDIATNITASSNSSTVKTAYEISLGTFPGWKATQRGSTVLFLADSVGPKTGAFSLAQTGAGTPAAGSFATTLTGVVASDTWVPQSQWNGDKLDGTGPSGVTLDPSKGNVYEIGMQYLGFGSIDLKIEAVPTNGNNPDLVVVHTFRFPNARTTPHVTNPSFPFTMAAYSAGSTTDVSVSVGSFGGFIEGQKRLTGPRMTYFNPAGATSSTSAYIPLFTFRNERVYGGRANQSIVNLMSVTGAARSANSLTTFVVIRDATITGTPNFTQFSTNSNTYWDTAATGCSFTNNEQIIWSGSVAESGQFNFSFTDDVTLQPGETATLAVRSVGTTAVCTGSINTREDQ